MFPPQDYTAFITWIHWSRSVTIYINQDISIINQSLCRRQHNAFSFVITLSFDKFQFRTNKSYIIVTLVSLKAIWNDIKYTWLTLAINPVIIQIKIAGINWQIHIEAKLFFFSFKVFVSEWLEAMCFFL
jgi:hypothetical protein